MDGIVRPPKACICSNNLDLGCVLSPSVHFSVACVARGWTVTEPTNPVSLWRVVVARVCDATEARVSAASRVRSYFCPRHIDCNHSYQTCA